MNFRRIIPFIIGFIVLIVVASALTPHFYILQRVNADEVGVRMRGGQILDVVPAGLYTDVGLYVEITRYSTQSYQFTVNDPEVITNDNQRLGVSVSGSVFRPDGTDTEMVRRLWTKYRNVYTSEEALQNVINDLSTQAMKVCVGDRPFQDSVIGSDRDALRSCMDTELNKLARNYGLTGTNVTVPNVSLSPEVQSLLDAITKSRLETEKAVQDKLKAISEGEARQAEQEAQIRIEQARIQEETRQQTILAKLNEEKLRAQEAVILAEKANALLAAQKDLEINKALAAAAQEKAYAELAEQIALAKLYEENPNYLNLQLAMANASAIKDTDKLIFTQEGVFPQIVFGEGLQPVVPVSPVGPGVTP